MHDLHADSSCPWFGSRKTDLPLFGQGLSTDGRCGSGRSRLVCLSGVALLGLSGMKAILLKEHGSTAGFRRKRSPPKCVQGASWSKWARQASTVDYKIRQGRLLPVGPELPGILHGDMAGTVAQVGEGRFCRGEEVYGCVEGSGLPGSCPNMPWPMPAAQKTSNLSMVEAPPCPRWDYRLECFDRWAEIASGKKSLFTHLRGRRSYRTSTGQGFWGRGSCHGIR